MTNVPATTTEPPDKPKRISKRIKTAIAAMVSGEAKNVTHAAELAGLSREHLSRELGKRHISAYLRDKVARNLSINAARAGAVKVELMESQNSMVADRASSFVLALAGISPEAAASAPRPGQQLPGLQIVVLNGTASPKIIGPEQPAAAQIIDVTPNAAESKIKQVG